MSQAVGGVISRRKGEPVEVTDIVIPDPGPGEVVVDITVEAIGDGVPGVEDRRVRGEDLGA